MSRPRPPPSPELLMEFLLWQQVLAMHYPAGPQSWFEDCVERWFLALLELDPQTPVSQLLERGIAG